MAFTYTPEWNITAASGRTAKSKAYSGSQIVELDESVADSQTDSQINVAIDVSAVKTFYVVSDQNVTLETNSGSTPADTIALKADVPYVWTTDSYDSFLLGTDVTAIFITNASGSTAAITLRALIDATP